MTDANTHAERYLAIWNETDAARRRAMIADAWTEDGVYVDPLMHGKGHDWIDCLVEGVQTRFPGFRFALIGEADGYGDNLRFSWDLGPEGGEPIIKGTDFARLENGRLKTVHGFLDQVPAAA
ncbi:nuclear transport factor 2 family protein [Neorhizobium sp. CSC1952]|uniref:nuclear transport factor 2 family protein n=1 Tax=Neorhizobium sp. CSC1952 TaxID=2978974 RepID=UPI0025A51D26|nr:nuclear transport factor 2 family protein [Rhizobium sp. CSC1952]WJR65319.1 nuclear transport factor 2 family protein [Rhizobium sp. CSC1952]